MKRAELQERLDAALLDLERTRTANAWLVQENLSWRQQCAGLKAQLADADEALLEIDTNARRLGSAVREYVGHPSAQNVGVPIGTAGKVHNATPSQLVPPTERRFSVVRNDATPTLSQEDA